MAFEVPEENEPEVLWMERTAKGDEEAFRRLVARYEKQILSLAYRYCGDLQESEDLAQEIFLKVYLNAGRWKPAARFSTWLFRVAVNHCLNHRRDRKRKPEEPLERVRLDRLDPAGAGDRFGSVCAPGSAGDDPSKRETATRVRKAVLALPPRQRMALILQRYHGLSYREIAGRMNCTQGAVESLLVRASENLREALGDLFLAEDRRNHPRSGV